jgi:hypothetical protein
MEAPMASHLPMTGTQTQLRIFDMKIQHFLDEYKHGNISENEVYHQLDEALGLLTMALRSNVLIRLRNLEGLRTPRGEHVPQTGGE